MDERRHAEALNAALDALRDGARLEDVAARLPAELRPLLDVGRGLGRSAAGVLPSSPSATFTLSLEEQLLTDMRLQGGAVPARRWGTWRNSILLGLLLLVGGVIALRSAGIGPFAPALAGGESASANQAMGLLEVGWQEIDGLRDDLDGGQTDRLLLTTRLERIVGAFMDALDAAQEEGDRRTAARVLADSGSAAARLATLAHGKPDPIRDEIIAARRLLVVRLLDSRVGRLDPPPIEDPGIIVSTAVPSPTDVTVPPKEPVEPTLTAVPTVAIETPTITAPIPTPSPLPTATDVPLDPPISTSVPRRTDRPPDPTETSEPYVPPTNTPDAWPTTGPTGVPSKPTPEPTDPAPPGAEPTEVPAEPTEVPIDPGSSGSSRGAGRS